MQLSQAHRCIWVQAAGPGPDSQSLAAVTRVAGMLRDTKTSMVMSSDARATLSPLIAADHKGTQAGHDAALIGEVIRLSAVADAFAIVGGQNRQGHRGTCAAGRGWGQRCQSW